MKALEIFMFVFGDDYDRVRDLDYGDDSFGRQSPPMTPKSDPMILTSDPVTPTSAQWLQQVTQWLPLKITPHIVFVQFQ